MIRNLHKTFVLYYLVNIITYNMYAWKFVNHIYFVWSTICIINGNSTLKLRVVQMHNGKYGTFFSSIDVICVDVLTWYFSKSHVILQQDMRWTMDVVVHKLPREQNSTLQVRGCLPAHSTFPLTDLACLWHVICTWWGFIAVWAVYLVRPVIGCWRENRGVHWSIMCGQMK